jgi:pimeloyl-ACP methyl ester carboxylesterase
MEQTPDLETWIRFVIDAITATPSRHVVLVGHSFSGIIAGAVADRLGDHVARLIYLDANLPVDGESFADSWSESGQEWLANQIAATPNRRWPPDLEQDETHLEDTQQMILLSQAYPMPAPPLYQRSVLSDRADQEVSTTYILCTKGRPELPADVHDRAQRSGWDLRHLDSAHWPMVSHPSELATMLHEISG